MLAEHHEHPPACTAQFLERTQRRPVVRIKAGVGRNAIVAFDLNIPAAKTLAKALNQALRDAEASEQRLSSKRWGSVE